MSLIAVAITAKTFVCLKEKEETELISEPSSQSELPKCQKQTQNPYTHTHMHANKHTHKPTHTHTQLAMKRVVYETEQAHTDLPLVSHSDVWRVEGLIRDSMKQYDFYIS